MYLLRCFRPHESYQTLSPQMFAKMIKAKAKTVRKSKLQLKPVLNPY